MAQIVKVIYDDGTEMIPKIQIKPLRKANEGENKFRLAREYEVQFFRFEDQILENLNQDNLEDYATGNFDLISEDDVEKKTIDDFDDGEIMQEVRDRKLLGDVSTIISESFITRFSKIMEKENQILLDNVLTEFEKKLNI
jgi:hypothetical protein